MKLPGSSMAAPAGGRRGLENWERGFSQAKKDFCCQSALAPFKRGLGGPLQGFGVPVLG